MHLSGLQTVIKNITCSNKVWILLMKASLKMGGEEGLRQTENMWLLR